MRITKAWSAASPQFLKALLTNEVLNPVVIEFYVDDARGVRVLDHTLKLSGALVSSIKHQSIGTAGATTAPSTETIEFIFGQIELIDARSKNSALDKLAP